MAKPPKKTFLQSELDEIARGRCVEIPEGKLTVGRLRHVAGTAAAENVTSVEVPRPGHDVPFRLSIRQLRPMLENQLRDAADDDRIELGAIT